jgi:hypothetical protein
MAWMKGDYLMAPADLLLVNRRRPFVPYRLYVSDGSAYEVRHPDLLMVGVRTALLGLPAATTPELFEQWVSIDLLHITRIDPIAPQAAAS